MIEELNNISSGAKFYRADLHIHSFGIKTGSYDVTDEQMTPENIVDTAIAENISIISITDHNEIGNVEIALSYAKNKPILIIPGIELSTIQGHLLIYFGNFEQLKTFHGKLDISGDRKMCNHTICQCLQKANIYNGIGILAHIDKDAGVEIEISGYPPFKEQIFLESNLLGIEITNAANNIWFTDLDSVSERKQIINKRRKLLKLEQNHDLAKILSSDAHKIEQLGLNAVGNKKLTRIKLDALTFHSFKVALIDSSARIRIEDLIPVAIPHFVGIRFAGGLLDKQIVKFSKNLTCLIGGRGTGKSTILESIRAASGNNVRENFIDNEVWPDRISLIYEDETGRQIIFSKDKLRELVNQSDPVNGITNIEIESIGQGETAETIRNVDKDPSILLKFIDEFIDFGTLKEDDNNICQTLLVNQGLIERLQIEVSNIPAYQEAKQNAEEQLKALKAKDAAKVVELEQSLVSEKALRSNLIVHLNKLFSTIKDSLSDKSVFNLVFDLDENKVFIGKSEFASVKTIIEGLSTEIDKISEKISTESKKIIEEIKVKLAEWKSKEAAIQTKIEDIRKDLEAKGIKLDIAFIRKVTQDVSDYNVKLNDLLNKQKTLKSLKDQRLELLNKRIEGKNKVFYHRFEYAKKLNDNLKATVVDYGITLKFYQGCYSQELQNIIRDAMNWRIFTKSEFIVSNLSYNGLLQSIRKSDISAFTSIQTVQSSTVFSKDEAKQIIQELSKPENLFKIERCTFNDFPEITITKQVTESNGSVKYLPKNFTKLSLGQQHSIMLSILLFSKRNCPLVIDQPEDNLDSEFIYRTLVKNLRKIKEHRQVIIVTHNANIAVLGDAELIIPLKSTSEKSFIINRGSIDNVETKKLTCEILEGGEIAFIKRKDIYGI